MQIQNKTSKMIFGIIMVLLLTVLVFLSPNDCLYGEQISLNIIEPQDRSKVCLRDWVRGNISDPNLQVYVLIHPMATNTIWVQLLPAKRENDWEAFCYFGEHNKGIGEQFEIIAVASKNSYLFKEGDTFPSPLQNNRDILFKSKPVIVTRASCLSPGEKGKLQKEQTPKPETESTKGAKTGEEGGLLSSILDFLKLLVVIVAVVGVGWLFYLVYRYAINLDRRIREIEGGLGLNNLRRIRERKEERREQSTGGMIKGEVYPSQEISKINQKIEAIEKQRSSEDRKITQEIQRQQKITSAILSYLKKDTSTREGLFQEIDNIQKGSISYDAEGIMGLEPKKLPPQTPKVKLPEEHLIEWWNRFGNSNIPDCRKTLKERFGNEIEFEVILGGKYPEEWRIIGVPIETVRNTYYVLPKKGDLWWDDYHENISEYRKWFELEEEKADKTLRIWSLQLSLSKARKNNSGQWELIGQKGRVSIKESQ